MLWTSIFKKLSQSYKMRPYLIDLLNIDPLIIIIDLLIKLIPPINSSNCADLLAEQNIIQRIYNLNVQSITFSYSQDYFFRKY